LCSFVHTDLKNADITFILACDRGVEVLSDRTARTRDCLTSALHPPKGRADRRTVGDRSRDFLSEKSGFFVGKVRVFCRVGCAQSIYLRNRLFFVRADAAEPSLGMSECQDDRKCAPPSRSGSDRTRSLPSALYTPSPSPRHSPESALASIHPLLRCTAAPGIISKRALRDSAHLHPQRHVQQLKRAMKRRAHQ
jgi:hypothetical protein